MFNLKNLVKLQLSLAVIVSTIFVSCGDKTVTQDLELLGLPVVVTTADSVKVENKSSSIQPHRFVLSQDSSYAVQTYAFEKITSDKAEVLKRVKEEIEALPNFVKIELEDVDGFIYQSEAWGKPLYHFKKVILTETHEIIMFEKMGEKFSKEAIEKMYNSIQQNTK